MYIVINCGWKMDGTEGGARDGDWVVLTSHFYGSHKGCEKAQLLYSGCVHFTKASVLTIWHL